MASTGMVLDGVFASEAIDSSGEVLKLEGLDISSLEAGDGTVNWEHQGEESKGFGQETVGRIIYARKIFSAKDCENDRQLGYWEQVKVPFLYGVARLYDGAGHDGAKAIAAQIRDAVANKEKILCRWSIEGSTLEKKGNELLACVARRVAITLKPCNKTAASGLIEDPQAPAGFEKKPGGEDGDDVLAALTNKHEHPNFRTLGAAFDAVNDPRIEDTQELLKAVAKLKAYVELRKATTAPVQELPLNQLTVNYNSLLGAFRNIRQGRGSKTPGPISVWQDPSGAYLIEDGHHRLVHHLLSGEHSGIVPVRVVGAGHSDNSVPTGWDRAELNPSQKYGGLESVVGEEQIAQVATHGRRLVKATTAGCPTGAPSTLTGGEALQREDLGRKTKLWKEQAFTAFREFEKKNEDFSKAEFTAFLKSKLPDCDPSFIDRFADLIEDYKVKLSKAEPEPEGGEDEGAEVKGPERLTIRGKLAPVKPGVTGFEFNEKHGILHTPRGSLRLYVPSYDKTPGAKEEFDRIMNDPQVNEVHDRAMEGWSRCHEALKAGKLPPEVVMHSVLFSMLSPNTPVPMQELMYAHLADTMKETGIDARNPQFSTLRDNWKARDQGENLPETGRQHFENLGRKIRVKQDTYVKKDKYGKELLLDENNQPILKRQAGELQSFMLSDNKFDNMAAYHSLHDRLMEAVQRHGVNGRALVAELMGNKNAAENHYNRRRAALKRGAPDIGEFQGATVPGLAQKTGRYTAGMLGAGNQFVPDTHMVRYLFGLEKGKQKDGPTIDYIKSGLWRASPETTKTLEAIDRYYFKHHDAVKHMLQHPKWGHLFKDDPEQAIYSAFWKNWCAIVPHERFRGLSTAGFNEGTDHMPYWAAIRPYFKSERADDAMLLHRTARLHRHWAQQYGEQPALMMYYAHIVPMLFEAAGRRQVGGDPMMKAESLVIDLKKALEDVRPGLAVGGGRTFQVLREAPDHYVARDGDGLVKLPKRSMGRDWELRNPPGKASDRATVDGKVHALPGSDGPEQHTLIHGLDLSGHDHTGSGWCSKGASPVFLRLDEAARGWGPARAEVAYYNAARDLFGLHQYVPVAAGFRHPRHGFDVAAIQAIPGVEHMNMNRDTWAQGAHANILRSLGDKGELDKLMLMDMVMGNDRTDHGVQFTMQAEPYLRLTDHGDLDGLTLRKPPPQHSPSYMAHYGYGLGSPWQGLPLHGAARSWLLGLDFRKLEASLQRSGMPAKQVDEAVRRLIETQAHVKQHGSTATKGSTYMAPWASTVNFDPED